MNKLFRTIIVLTILVLLATAAQPTMAQQPLPPDGYVKIEYPNTTEMVKEGDGIVIVFTGTNFTGPTVEMEVAILQLDLTGREQKAKTIKINK